MDKYIKQLLEQYSKVILPKFGAIVIENDETGELMFNEYLNYNDGKLDAIIEKESNMELQEAQNMIAKYIRDIQAQIDKGESYDIFGLGSFSKNKDGEVEFSGNIKTGEAKKVASTAGPSPTPAKKEEETKEEPVKKEEPAKKEATKKEEKSTDKKENKYVAPVPSTKESTKKTEDKPKGTKATDAKQEEKLASHKKDKAAKEEKLKAKKKAEEDKHKAKEKAKKEKEEAKKAKAKSKEEKKNKKIKDPKSGGPKKKRKVGVFGWVIIVLLFLAAGGSITAGVYYDEISDYMGWNEFADQKEIAQNDTDLTDESSASESEANVMSDDQKEVDDEAVDNNQDKNNQENTVADGSTETETIDTEKVNTANVETEKVEPETTSSYSSNTSSGSYHLIAGGFREKSNAEDLVSELSGKGLNAQIIGRINGLHYVSAKSYTSLQSAKQDINNIRSQVPGAWIYKN